MGDEQDKTHIADLTKEQISDQKAYNLNDQWLDTRLDMFSMLFMMAVRPEYKLYVE